MLLNLIKGRQLTVTAAKMYHWLQWCKTSSAPDSDSSRTSWLCTCAVLGINHFPQNEISKFLHPLISVRRTE